MVAVEIERIDAVLLWINHYGFDERLRLPTVEKLTELWRKHLLSVASFLEAKEPSPCSVSNPTETFELALGVLNDADAVKSVEQRGRVRSLCVDKAANGNETEIYKFVVLLLHEISLLSKEWIQKFIPELQQKNLELPFAKILEQCAGNTEGDSWWRSEPFTPNRDIVLTPIRNGGQTPKTRKPSQSKFTIEEVFYKDDSGSPVKTVLNSPRINEMRYELFSARERKMNEKIHVLDEEKMILEEKLNMLRKETGDLNLAMHEWKSKATDLERELQRANEYNKKISSELELTEREKRTLQKQSEDKGKAVLKYKDYLEDCEVQRGRVNDELTQLQQDSNAQVEELLFLREEKLSLVSENNDLKRSVITLEKQVQDLSMKLDLATKEVLNEKGYCAEKLKEKEHELMMMVEDERNLRIDAHKELRQAEEKLTDMVNMYNANLEREKLSALRYKQSKEEAEAKLLIKKKEWDEYMNEVKSSHEREISSLCEFKDYYEKKHESLNEELESLKAHLSKTNSEFSNRETEFIDCMKSLKSDLEKADHEKKSLKIQIAEEDAKLTKMKKELDDITLQRECEVHNLEQALNDARGQIMDLEKVVSDLHYVADDMANKLNVAEDYMINVFEENKYLREQLESTLTHTDRIHDENPTMEMANTGEEIPEIDFISENNDEKEIVEPPNDVVEELNELVNEQLALDDFSTAVSESVNTVIPDVNEDEEPCEMFSTMLDGSCVSSVFLPSRQEQNDDTESDQQEGTQEQLRQSSFDFAVPAIPKKSPKHKETDRSRLFELQERNKQVPSALRSSYALETMNYPSPTGTENSVKGKGSTGGKAFMKRMSSYMLSKKGKENEEANANSKAQEQVLSREPLVNKNF